MDALTPKTIDLTPINSCIMGTLYMHYGHFMYALWALFKTYYFIIKSLQNYFKYYENFLTRELAERSLIASRFEDKDMHENEWLKMLD